MIELSAAEKYPVTKFKPFEKEISHFSVSSNSNYLVCLSGNNDEMCVVDLENDFKVVNKWSYRFFDRMWDSFFKSKILSVFILNADILVFYNQDGQFRIIDFGKKKQSAFNFLEQSQYLKYDFKPCDKKEFLNSSLQSCPKPLCLYEIIREASSITSIEFVN
jgi:hypothetical protein